MEEFINEVVRNVSIGHVYMHVAVTLLCWALTVGAILVDLWDGVYTARKLGEKLRSHKFRRTVQKMGEYWRVLLFGFAADTLGVMLPWWGLPYVTMCMAAALVVVEAKSVFEHFRRRKSCLAELPSLVSQIVECAAEKDAVRLLAAIREELEAGGDKK